MPQPGESLDGYRVIRLIGAGGFGEVWLCQSEALGDLRALKFIPATSGGQIEKEFDALCRYRTAAGRLRSPSIMPIEHVNRTSAGLFYIMPLADGQGSSDPLAPSWRPLTLAAMIEGRWKESAWFTSGEIKGCLNPILQALQLLSDAGLVHRDVKPDNILFLNGTPCLGDISLLGEDSHNITRRGTPGYSAPSWFVESGGHPDMFGAATTLYTLLTGNPPDKMGRVAFRWPPQGEGALSDTEKQEWLRIHRIIRRTVDERPAERFRTFDAVAEILNGVEDAKKRPGATRWIFTLAGLAALVLVGIAVATLRKPPGPNVELPRVSAPPVQNSDPSNPGGLTDKELADYRVTATLAAIYFKDKEYQAALDMLNQLNATYPISTSFPYYSTLRAQCLYGLGRQEEAHEELRRGLLGKRLDLASFAERMKLWDALHDLQGAEAEATGIIENSSPITRHYTARARIRLRLGNFDGAEKDIHSASTLDDDPGRVGLAAKLRAQYAEEFPEYARFLSERGIVPDHPKPLPSAALPTSPPSAPQQDPTPSGQSEPAAQGGTPGMAELRQLFDKDFVAAKAKILGPRQKITGEIAGAVKALAAIEITSASTAQHVIEEVDRVHAKTAKEVQALPGPLTAEERRTLLGPTMSVLAKMETAKKTVEEHVAFEQKDSPQMRAQIHELNQELDREPQFRIELVQKVSLALAELDKEFRRQTGQELGALSRFVTLPMPAEH